MRRSSPVQQWLDSLPNDAATTQEENNLDVQSEPTIKPKSNESNPDDSVSEITILEPATEKLKCLDVPNTTESNTKPLKSEVSTSTPLKDTTKRLQRDHSVQSDGCSPKFKNPLLRDASLQSDASGSSGSSVLNVLGARKVDAESVLLALGFGPSEKQQKLQRIPDRFLTPSKLKGISTEEFIKNEQHSMRMHDCGVFGYRGLTGNPHVPPSTIVAKIMDCILQDDVCREEALIKARHSIADMRSPPNVYAILSARLRNN